LHSDSLEFFRPKHGHQQIAEQQQRNDADDDVLHGFSYSFSQKRTYSALTTKNATTIPT
jgi:hypothetical protein